MNTDKVSFNLNLSTLGKIDLLIDQGLYDNRTHFITTAIHNEILKNEYSLNKTIAEKSIEIGIITITADYLEKIAESNSKIELRIIGMLRLEDKITLELAEKSISKIVLFGKFKGPTEIKNFFNL